MLEDEAIRRACEAIRRPVLYRGKQVYVDGLPLYETTCSDALLMFLLKAYNPEKFGDKQHVEVWNGDLDSLTDQQLERVLTQLRDILQRGYAPDHGR